MNEYNIGAGKVKMAVQTLNVDWIAGNVDIIEDKDLDFFGIAFDEEYEGELEDKDRLHWNIDGTTVNIFAGDYSRTEGKHPRKKLTIRTSRRLFIDDLSVKTFEADVYFYWTAGDRFKVTTLSGDITMACNPNSAILHTTSGNIVARFTSWIPEIDCSSVGGNVKIVAEGPGSIRLSSIGGDVICYTNEPADDLTMTSVKGKVFVQTNPESGFKLQAQSVSGTISTDGYRYLKKDGNLLIFRNGHRPYKMYSCSGDVIICPNPKDGWNSEGFYLMLKNSEETDKK